MAQEKPSCDCESDLDLKKMNPSVFRLSDFRNPILSLIFLAAAYFILSFYSSDLHFWIALFLLLISYLLVGFSVIKKAAQLVAKGSFFNEFMLMSLATFGAFYIGDYLEGVFVMLFYATGEIVQANAVRSVRNSIKNLLDLQVRLATVIKGDSKLTCPPQDVKKGDLIQVLPGEMLPVDGAVLENEIQLNTANITGEAISRTFKKGDTVLAGMICIQSPLIYKASADWDNSYISKIMHLVEEATHKKAKTQRLISRLAKIYTPIVFFLALAVIILPYFFVIDYVFNEWLYRGLVFLVISCPCAFLIAIPLSYFGGIGLAAKKGILFKGSDVIEKLIKLKSIVFDKTGTITTGKFKVDTIEIIGDKQHILSSLVALENHSKHPFAQAISTGLTATDKSSELTNISEVPGKGIQGLVNGKPMLAGNAAFLRSHDITFGNEVDPLATVHIAFDNNYAGYITFTDELKPTAHPSIKRLRLQGIKKIGMLSGDKQEVVDRIASYLKLDVAHGELLPEDKVNTFLSFRDQFPPSAFVGDGVNDAPVLAGADIGIAMGAYGSDSAIQSADMVIEDDDLIKIPAAIDIAQKTQKNVWQNLWFAAIVKVLVLLLGTIGIAGLGAAIFADVGVALLVILNAYRLKNYNVV